MSRDFKNFGRATHCSIGFFALFIALNAQQNIQAQMLEDDGYGKLGLYSNAVIYLAVAIGSVISTSVMNKIGEIWTMVLGSFLCVPFMTSFLLASVRLDYPELSSGFCFTPPFVYTILLISSFVHGLAEGGLFVAQGKYIADCATVSNKGFFFGYFWAFYMASQIIGNFIAAIMLGKLNQTEYVSIMTTATFLSAIIFLFMKKPIPHNLVLPNDQFSYSKLSTAITEMNTQENPTTSYGEDIVSVLKMTVSKRMRMLLPLCIWTGLSIAFYSGILVSMLADTMPNENMHVQYEKSMMAMVVFGVGEMFGCFFIGFVVDKKGSRFATGVDVMIILIMTMSTLMFLSINEFNWLAYFMTFMWGFQDSAVNTHLQEMLGFEFENNSEPFSVFNMIQALSVFIFEIVETQVDTYPSYVIYTLFVGCVGFFSCATTFFFDFKVRKKDDEHSSKKKTPEKVDVKVQ